MNAVTAEQAPLCHQLSDAPDIVPELDPVAGQAIRWVDRIGPDGNVTRIVTDEDRTEGGVTEETMSNLRREARLERHRRHR